MFTMKNFVLAFVFLVCIGGCTRNADTELRFVVTHDGMAGEELTGRVYIMLTKKPVPLLGGPDWYNPEPFFAMDVENWKVNTPLNIG